MVLLVDEGVEKSGSNSCFVTTGNALAVKRIKLDTPNTSHFRRIIACLPLTSLKPWDFAIFDEGVPQLQEIKNTDPTTWTTVEVPIFLQQKKFFCRQTRNTRETRTKTIENYALERSTTQNTESSVE